MSLNEGKERVFLESLITGDPSAAIETQEARGQRAFVASTTLPIKCQPYTREPTNTRKQIEAMGIVFGEPVDDLFIEVQLPEGWKKEATDHSMWSKLIDEKGRERASIFYKAAFYDRDAFMSLTRRFHCKTEPVCGYADPEYRKHKWHCIVTDYDEIVWRSDEQLDPEPAWSETESWSVWFEKKDVLAKSGIDWLDEHYPDWKNPLAYWD